MKTKNILTRLFFLSTLAIIGACSGLKNSGDVPEVQDVPEVHFKGYYYLKGIVTPTGFQSSNFTYFKFMEDGGVKMLVSASDSNHAAEWFKRRIGMAQGEWKSKGSSIAFSVNYAGNIISYEGVVEEKYITVDIYPSKSGHIYKDRLYYFEKPEAQDAMDSSKNVPADTSQKIPTTTPDSIR